MTAGEANAERIPKIYVSNPVLAEELRSYEEQAGVQFLLSLDDKATVRYEMTHTQEASDREDILAGRVPGRVCRGRSVAKHAGRAPAAARIKAPARSAGLAGGAHQPGLRSCQRPPLECQPLYGIDRHAAKTTKSTVGRPWHAWEALRCWRRPVSRGETVRIRPGRGLPCVRRWSAKRSARGGSCSRNWDLPASRSAGGEWFAPPAEQILASLEGSGIRVTAVSALQRLLDPDAGRRRDAIAENKKRLAKARRLGARGDGGRAGVRSEAALRGADGRQPLCRGRPSTGRGSQAVGAGG